ncbi:perlucin-like protein isoform X1 [Crassostrea virginica]
MLLYMFLVVGLAGFVNLSRVCENGWMAYNNNCYWFSTSGVEFKDAVKNCVNIGSSLIEFSERVEENWVVLQSKIRDYKNIWVGLTDILIANTFVLASTGNKPSYTNWARGQPQRNKEHCTSVSLSQRKWHDFLCSKRLHYICRKPANHYA